jgi:hypothetical protein
MLAAREEARPNLVFEHIPPDASRQPLTGMTASPMMNNEGRTLRSVWLTGRD